MPRWLLPESISDVLPSQARAIEVLRRRLLDLYRTYGYELVMPPMLEHIESLLTGSGRDLAHRTIQLVDQLSGRTLGIRADMTPQVARIDAHLLNRVGIARLCYSGSVLHARPAGLFASREPMQVGAELFGHAGLEADLEVIELMIASLVQAGVSSIRLDLCHAGIVPSILALDPALDAARVYEALHRKDLPALAEYLLATAPDAGPQAAALARSALLALPELYGEAHGQDSAIARGRALLPDLEPVRQALDTIERLADSPLWQRYPEVEISVDLADQRG
ncbi:MAG: ATP phosphoribosyltransferase regulatory subunit, partial [Quisquiliibacterium sp.]